MICLIARLAMRVLIAEVRLCRLRRENTRLVIERDWAKGRYEMLKAAIEGKK